LLLIYGDAKQAPFFEKFKEEQKQEEVKNINFRFNKNKISKES